MTNKDFLCSVCQLVETSRDMMFPEEIWEEIFKRIDDVDDLIKLQSVCLNFNKWIQRLLDRDIYWKKYCQDIPDECSYAILNKVFPDLVHDVDVSWQDIIDNYRWRKIYMSRKKWNSCLKRKPFIDSVKNFPSFSKYECITCTAVWGNNHIYIIHFILIISINISYIFR